MPSYTTAQSRSDLEQILALQRSNLPGAAPGQDQQGFVTLQYTVPLLESVCGPYRHVIAKDGEQVVGYTLVLLLEAKAHFPEIANMFEAVDAWRTTPARYFVMGQVCVADGYRGQGVFRGLYHKLREEMQEHFDFVATDVSRNNLRSMNAHAGVGFKEINQGSPWQVIVWDWQ
ncbi:MAG: GNAT family N-acetyltransferase [Burkholderiaceae bacterium]|nr:GNAT family N-acetyltransferase [Burkholderiaceae bacterium]